MRERIIIYMVLKNVYKRQQLFERVVLQASKISKDFYIINHGSDYNTAKIINNLKTHLGLNLELINDDFIGTMDDIKGKYYKVLKEQYGLAICCGFMNGGTEKVSLLE